MAKQAFDIRQINSIIGDITKLGNDLPKVVAKSIEESAKKATANLTQQAGDTAGYPAGGKYSTGLTSGMVMKPEIVWKSESLCYVRWGFDLNTYGTKLLTPVFLMYGVDGRQRPVNPIRKAIFSAIVLQEFTDKAIEDVEDAIARL